ncbi:Multicopper oxidase with three cupredoxin domains (includes cell division protein FtsP and spore coat protein CotA) [Roseivivax halotolerans]|uniref:Multicopper oxidase with three cupredoxin domains (Includes cell division protein FtsP and spore coat protein CotA) n=1 Tax=Roseivivax halotolerans TaxID=93684 RepID=A0A1I5UQC4_9RHOB|nr:multicopper oxidase family protein [Roseivivax halotolerans]SFP97483.1 Multicopper oxidase with three cupredoxin domains (includes cell division protein FtsP and spore coat protein CotA) [Roseivivax halotolerans]
MLSRRFFLQALGAAGTIPALPRGVRAALPVLEAGASRVQIAPEGYSDTALWTFNGSFPGPELRFAQGERFAWRVENRLETPTAVHWHGIRIDNAMDGVPGVTQDPILPGTGFDYDFVLPDAGTYWYHSHAQSVEQVERGLYGALVVEETDPPEVDADITLVIDDIRLGDDAQIIPDFDNMHDRSHAGRIGNVILTNGRPQAEYQVRQHDRLRLRLINASNARIFELGLYGLAGWIVALDGMPLAEPEAALDTLTLAPAQRMDLIVDVTGEDEAFLLHFDRTGGYAQASFRIGSGTRARREPPAALPPNPDFPIDLANAVPQRVLMEGGAMRGLSEAMHLGEVLTGRQLAEKGLFWALNGQVGRDMLPLLEVPRGQSVRLGIVNDTAFPHAMHLHGMHFAEVLPDSTLGPLRDTILLAQGETKELAFAAHNPGDWLFHCHMLGHHAAGMGTFIRVTG